jgi:hypothetical protein
LVAELHRLSEHFPRFGYRKIFDLTPSYRSGM